MRFEASVAPRVYRQILTHLLANKNPHTVRGLEMYSEIIGATVFIEWAASNELEIPGRDFKAYSYCEALWDLCPSAEVSILRAFNKNIDRFVNDQPEGFRDEAIWAYGPTVNAELPKIVAELKKDPWSRRAVISIPRNLEAQGTHPCLESIQFLIREHKGVNCLHAVVKMRSNDIWLGFPIDIFQFSLMQHVVASAVDLPVGTYTHYAGSLHLYARDVEAATKMNQTIPWKQEFNQMRGLHKNALRWVVDGLLLADLRNVATGYRVIGGPFKNYIDYLQETWFKKHGS